MQRLVKYQFFSESLFVSSSNLLATKQIILAWLWKVIHSMTMLDLTKLA